MWISGNLIIMYVVAKILCSFIASFKDDEPKTIKSAPVPKADPLKEIKIQARKIINTHKKCTINLPSSEFDIV